MNLISEIKELISIGRDKSIFIRLQDQNVQCLSQVVHSELNSSQRNDEIMK